MMVRQTIGNWSVVCILVCCMSFFETDLKFGSHQIQTIKEMGFCG